VWLVRNWKTIPAKARVHQVQALFFVETIFWLS
jgi:hypothetical protein